MGFRAHRCKVSESLSLLGIGSSLGDEERSKG
jgi:hypothetical protein